MPQVMSVSELQRIAALHGGMTPEGWLMDWAAGEITSLRLWKEDAQEALEQYRAGEEKNFALIKEMHEVIVQISDTAHQQQMALSKYIEVTSDYFAPKKRKK